MYRLLTLYFLILFSGMCLYQCEPGSAPIKPAPEATVEEEIPTSELLKQLDSTDVFLKSQATIQLGSRKEKSAIPKLRILLSDMEPGVRAGAAIALGELQDRVSTSGILNLLEKDKEITPDVYLDALSRLKDPSVGKRILFLLDSNDATLRLQTVEALVQIGAREAGAAILKMALGNKDREKDKTYAMAIGKLGYRGGEKYLLKLSETQDESPTLAATYLALGRIKSKNALNTLVGALKHSYSKGKENSSIALIEIGDPRTISLAFPLIEIAEEETRNFVTDVLCSIPSKEAGERALGLLHSNKKNTWGSAAKIVGRQKFGQGRIKIEELLLLESTPERDLFAESLGWLGNKESIPVLRKVLTSKSKEGRSGSAWALGILGAVEALDDLSAVLNDSDPKLVRYSLEAIGAIADPKSLPTLKRLLADRPNMASLILSAIGRIPGAEARAVVESASRSTDENVYRPAFEQIAKRQDKESIDLMIEYVNGESNEKRKLAYYALTSITGEHFKTKNDWNAWRLKSNR